ncbi:MAG: stage II sporulation protein P [Anaerotignaceae bacterium]
MMVIRAFRIRKKFLRLLMVVLVFAVASLIAVCKNPKYETDDGDIFAMEEGTEAAKEILDVKELLKTEVTADLSGDLPKVLIFHSHSQEEYSDGGTVVDAGDILADVLAQEYGITVVHDVNEYDMENGERKIDGSYERMETGVKEILKKYPTIEVCIDLHRDSAQEGIEMTCDIGGKDTARLMLVNGVCTAQDSGENPYIKENLALSLKMYSAFNENYNGLARRIYLKPYRYSTFIKPRSLLVEVGCESNTLEQAQNAMYPLADILINVLEES